MCCNELLGASGRRLLRMHTVLLRKLLSKLGLYLVWLERYLFAPIEVTLSIRQVRATPTNETGGKGLPLMFRHCRVTVDRQRGSRRIGDLDELTQGVESAFLDACAVESAGYRRAGICRSCDRYSCLSTVATNLLAEAFNARDSLRIILSVGDLSPRSSWLI